MPFHAAVSLKNFPFVRLLAALTAGIVAEWYFDPAIKIVIYTTAVIFCVLLCFSLLPQSKKFTLRWLPGCFIFLVFAGIGMILTWRQNIQNDPAWFGKTYQPGNTILLTLKEQLTEKPKTFKALATVEAVYTNTKTWKPTEGSVLLYFKKDSSVKSLRYGSQIILNKSLQAIQSSGNPAAFDYKRYCLFRGITDQIFINNGDYFVLPEKHANPFQQFLFSARDAALHTMQQNIHSSKELGIAEALLIGYRNDLDKDLVQAYSDTGVVHIIAISGLHIGVIYTMLVAFFSMFKPGKLKKWTEPVLILLVIWMFTLIAGAAPSILRASVMFTCILIGKFLNRNGNIYNTLAASAFILLAWDPYNLWDVGFQLSYAAVLSIVVFFKPVNNLMFFQNKSLRWIWKLSAVTLSAQIFALPLVVYNFHQLPLLFLFSNLVAVPLSSLVLFGELLLFCFSWWHAAAAFTGSIIQLMIKCMNDFIEHIDRLPFSVWDALHIYTWQLVILFACIAALSTWIFHKKRSALIAALSFLILFFVMRDIDLIRHKDQQKLIVYNVPQHPAIDFIAGNSCYFAGDSSVITDAFLRNFNLKPSRVKDRVYTNNNILLPNIKNIIMTCGTKKILILNGSVHASSLPKKIPVDIIILSGNAKISIAELQEIFDCKQVVADNSNPSWKCAQWKKDCEQLHLRFHSVTQDGAFTLKI